MRITPVSICNILHAKRTVSLGPYALNIFDPRSWGNGDTETINTITLEFTRVVLAIGVFAIGVELPKAYMARHWRSLFFLLAPVMTWVSVCEPRVLSPCLFFLMLIRALFLIESQGWFVSAALIFAFIPNLTFLSSLLSHVFVLSVSIIWTIATTRTSYIG